MLSLMSLLDEDEEGHHEVEKTRCCKGNSISELGPGGGGARKAGEEIKPVVSAWEGPCYHM